MNNKFEESPLYRFFNVLALILYCAVVLVAIGSGLIAYSSRSVTSANVSCKDGTQWNATKIYWDSEALCGICTQRNQDGSKYTDCSYDKVDYSSYTVSKKYGWTWWIVFAPLIIFSLGVGLVDFLKIAMIYIFSGKVSLEKSVLLRTLVLLFSSNQSNN